MRRSVISASVKPFHREFRGTVGGVRNARPDRGPEAIDAAGIDNVARIGPLKHGQEGTRAVVDAAPADIERPLPLLAGVGDHTAAAPDAGVVEQQMDPVGIVAIRHLISELLHLRCVGHVGYMRGEAQALRQSRHLTEPVRLCYPGRRDVAHRDIAPFRD